MAHAGQFGIRYAQVVDRFFHALEWRYNEILSKKGSEREREILAKLLDEMLADQVGHDIVLHDMEEALRQFQRVRHDSFTPNKYKDILRLMQIDEKSVEGYQPHLFGNVIFDSHASSNM